MLMQAYDFVHLNREYGCTLQYGGADQWGNIAAGSELQRKLNFQNGTNVQLVGATTTGFSTGFSTGASFTTG